MANIIKLTQVIEISPDELVRNGMVLIEVDGEIVGVKLGSHQPEKESAKRPTVPGVLMMTGSKSDHGKKKTFQTGKGRKLPEGTVPLSRKSVLRLAERCRAVKGRNDWTTAELAEAGGISESWCSKVCRAWKVETATERMLEFFDAIGVEYADLPEFK